MNIEYIPRTRDYYRAQGFERDYTWADNKAIPFSKPKKPLRDARLAIITTAVVEPAIPKPIRSAKSYCLDEIPEHFDTSELSWDKTTTHTNDRESYFPIQALTSKVDDGSLGSLAPRFHFVPTEYSQRHTLTQDAPLIAANCQEDAVDLAILIPI